MEIGHPTPARKNATTPAFLRSAGRERKLEEFNQMKSIQLFSTIKYQKAGLPLLNPAEYLPTRDYRSDSHIS
ncbi:hypothetical protein VTN77DRAFT_8689 [Rasamsonia byssochlamydoides]|uniref:uncharacterized protein n=1 Tax=Rasamsonia byssochlamydoides TaxID=89139 RepID=UPI0037443768